MRQWNKRWGDEDFPHTRPKMIQKMGIAKRIGYAHFERLICAAVENSGAVHRFYVISA